MTIEKNKRSESKRSAPLARRALAGLVVLTLVGSACGNRLAGDASGVVNMVETDETLAEETEVLGESEESNSGDSAVPFGQPGGPDFDDDGSAAGDAGSAASSGEIRSWSGVPDGVVQIFIEGAFVRADFDSLTIFRNPDSVLGGSGFTIDGEGLILTNNHVVSGASSIDVRLPGDSRSRNAQVLGTSECWDLAVIRANNVTDGRYFRWIEESPPVATDVYAVGFPLLDEEITVTKGVISKASVVAHTRWASVEDAIETDADINPGNSGGPLVTENGTVVGINFAGNDLRQGFAIKADAAMAVVERLMAGEDVDYLGINGLAVSNFDTNGILPNDVPGGIFVESIETGSPAFTAGVRAGDIITSVEGTSIAADGTMSEYCDILRTKNAADDLLVTVLDPDGESFELLIER
ncbi:MAG: trypsin-like peptidase domain-containing protein [Acidimicrobiales bacterium]